MPMFKRFTLLAASLVVAGTATAASPLDRQMREVERLRGVTFLHDVTQRTIDRSELGPLIREQIAKSIPYSIEDYVEILKALQLVDASTTGIVDRMFKLYDSQVLAFYDPITHTYFAIRQLPESVAALSDSSVLRDSVVIHELVHALQDQRFGAAARDRALRHDTDGELAYHALLEGEASLVMMNYLLEKSGQSFEDAVKSDLLIGAMGAASTAENSIQDAPAYFIESLKFPYLDGLRLVVTGYRRGGWKAIDKMHANPPRTTREVLHPAEYFARLDRGQLGASPFDPPSTPDIVTIERLGEFHWRFLIGEQADGWIDDRVTLACNGRVTAQTSWENAAKAAAFRDAYVRFLRDRGIEPEVVAEGTAVRVAYLP